MFVSNIKLDVIATYEGDLEQDHFECAVTKKSLKNEKTLLNYITNQLESEEDLVKLSLCWICNEETVKKYKTIKDSIKKNAKYYFNSYEKDTLDKTIELIKGSNLWVT